MSEWETINLGEVIQLIGGGTPKTTCNEYWNGDIPWLSVVDFNNAHKYVDKTEKNITQTGLENSSTKLLSAGDIIISARGTVGVLAILKKTMAFNQSCYGVRGKNDIAFTDWVYYQLKNTVHKLSQISHGGVFDTITRCTFDEIEIELPSIPEQKAIASVLSSLDDKIDLLHRQNKTLELMAETLFRQWFVEEAQDKWLKGTLNDEFHFVMGQSPSGASFNEDFIGIPMYQGNADFGFRFPSPRVFTTEPTRYAEAMDTLISVRAPVGAQNMASQKCCIGRGVAAFRHKTNPEFYTYTYFKLRELMGKIKHFNDEGTVFGSISKSDFEKIEIIIPPHENILAYEKMTKPVNDKIIKNCYQISKIEKLRDILLPKLMSGEVRVKYTK